MCWLPTTFSILHLLPCVDQDCDGRRELGADARGTTPNEGRKRPASTQDYVGISIMRQRSPSPIRGWTLFILKAHQLGGIIQLKRCKLTSSLPNSKKKNRNEKKSYSSSDNTVVITYHKKINNARVSFVGATGLQGAETWMQRSAHPLHSSTAEDILVRTSMQSSSRHMQRQLWTLLLRQGTEEIMATLSQVATMDTKVWHVNFYLFEWRIVRPLHTPYSRSSLSSILKYGCNREG
jgi:hypothetical protein